MHILLTCRTGVEIEDCGPKSGLNGVDNGKITCVFVAFRLAAFEYA